MTRKCGDRPHVFCIGWHKTGTTTLGLALIELGYSVVGCRLDMIHPLRRGDLDSVLKIAGQFDAVQDVPWAALFRELDERYPGSRFILTERDESSWLQSASRHFSDGFVPLHEWLYGEAVLKDNESLYLKRYHQHNRDVKDYFDGREGDLLVMSLQDGDGWDALCKFLGHEIPKRQFPHANKAPHSYTTRDKIWTSFRHAVPGPVRKVIFSLRQRTRDWMGKPDPRDRFNNFKQNRVEIHEMRKHSR